jgi:hypothetical protein
MVIRCFGDDLTGFVHDGFHGPPPIQRASQRRRDGARIYLTSCRARRSNPMKITASVFGGLCHIAHRPLCTNRHKIKPRVRRRKYIRTGRFRVPRRVTTPKEPCRPIAEGPPSFNSRRPTRSEGSAPPPDDDTLASVTPLLEIAFPHQELQHAAQTGNPREFPAHRHTVAPAVMAGTPHMLRPARKNNSSHLGSLGWRIRAKPRRPCEDHQFVFHLACRHQWLAVRRVHRRGCCCVVDAATAPTLNDRLDDLVFAG